eukprot:CAMPEP_0176047314 /NCGR_PEP_ID=MMETSP0120_2-20121206/23498_1 /TAXON_ID=160619 /ORGANISM="Kryptoperidinium foliaceum, Strain CCMP 1326" /LENGTH=381 /DNA_ID=CAMNT_0017380729 /DNA_START=34 /DNA_END=1180 /DNA_ORIENTATION=-
MAADSEMSLLAKAQVMAHGTACTLVLPGLLLVVSALLLAYRGITEEEHHLPLNGFLAIILIQMLPLVALKAKIYHCTDRVSLVPMVLVKTLMMHVTIGVFRISSALVEGGDWTKITLMVDGCILLIALGVLKFEFGFSLSPVQWYAHADVRNLVALALAGAFITEAYFCMLPASWLSDKMQYYKQQGLDIAKVLFTAGNYVDIVAFMPVVWRLYQTEAEYEDYNVGANVSSDAKRQVKAFFIFVVGFYMWDDVVDPVTSLLDEPIALMAHAAHFSLLLDFAAFFAFQVSQPTAECKEQSEQLQGLLAQMEEEGNAKEATAGHERITLSAEGQSMSQMQPTLAQRYFDHHRRALALCCDQVLPGACRAPSSLPCGCGCKGGE